MLFEDIDTLNEMIDLIRGGAVQYQQHHHQGGNRDTGASQRTGGTRRFRELNVSIICGRR